jgi:hypothetical protein
MRYLPFLGAEEVRSGFEGPTGRPAVGLHSKNEFGCLWSRAEDTVKGNRNVMGWSTSSGGIIFISEMIVLRQTDARLIRGKPLCLFNDVRPYGCHGRLGVSCQKTSWCCGKTLPGGPRMLAHGASSSLLKRKGNLKEMGKSLPWDSTPVNVFNDLALALRHLL